MAKQLEEHVATDHICNKPVTRLGIKKEHLREAESLRSKGEQKFSNLSRLHTFIYFFIYGKSSTF